MLSTKESRGMTVHVSVEEGGCSRQAAVMFMDCLHV